MTRFPHDQFAKDFLESLLSPLGQVQTSLKISGEVREMDVYFTPDPSLSPRSNTENLTDVVVRLLGKWRVQSQAIQEVATLPPENLYRQNALDLLGNLKVILEARETIDPEERELVMQLSPLYLEKIQAAERVGEERGEERGRQEGEMIGEVRMVVRQLNRRLGELPERCSAQIQQLTLPQLEELGEALLDFTSLADLEGWLGQDR